MGNTVATPEQRRTEAQRLYETEGWSQRRIGAHLGIQPSTVGRWAKADGWTPAGNRHKTPTPTELMEAEARAQAASLAAKARWAVARADVADKAGKHADTILDKILARVEAGKDSEARQLAVVFGILVDKATLLSGDALAGGRNNRAGDSGEPSPPAGPRPTDPTEMAKEGKRRALLLVPPRQPVDVPSREVG